MTSSQYSGVFAIAPTPFDRSGAVDMASIDTVVDCYSEAGVSGFTVLGQLGEAGKLESAEAIAVARRFIERTTLPVVVGISAPGFAAMGSLASTVMDIGAQAVMIAPPNTLRANEDIVRYYRQASGTIGSDIPFVIQDYPLTFSVVMSPEVIREIVNENPNCVCLKHEDWPGLEKITALRSYTEGRQMRELPILCGNNALFLDFEMRRGADGAMTGYCFPEMLVDVVRLAAAGQADAAQDLFDAHLPLVRYEQQPGVGLAVRKYVLARRGIIATDHLRTPGSVLNATARAEVDYLLGRLARRDPRAKLA